MEGAADDALRERWRIWAQQQLGGSQAQVDAATDAVMKALAAKGNQSEAVEQARAAWSAAGPRPAPQTSAQVAAEPRAQGVADAIPMASSHGAFVPRGRGVTGRVAGFQARIEQLGRRNVSVWDFRVERQDGPAAAVEMRGYSFHGSVANGDEVQLAGATWDRGIIHANKLENLTSNSTVRVTSRPHPVVRGIGTAVSSVFRIVLLLVVLAVIAAAAIFILNHGSP